MVFFSSTAKNSRTFLEDQVSFISWLIHLPLLPIAPYSLSLFSSYSTFFSLQHASIVYSEVKTQPQDDVAGKISSKEEDAMERYENVLLLWLIPDPNTCAVLKVSGVIGRFQLSSPSWPCAFSSRASDSSTLRWWRLLKDFAEITKIHSKEKSLCTCYEPNFLCFPGVWFREKE